MILTNEDLLAISQVVDTRLDIRLKPIEEDISLLKDDIKSMQTDIKSMKTDIISMQNDIESVKTGLHNVNLFQENIILPRLNTIESCYLDTYNLYQKNSDKMEVVYDDVSLLKRVVTDHSEKLQKLA